MANNRNEPQRPPSVKFEARVHPFGGRLGINIRYRQSSANLSPVQFRDHMGTGYFRYPDGKLRAQPYLIPDKR